MVLIHDYAGHPFEVQLSRELHRRGLPVTHAFAGSIQTPRGGLSEGDGGLRILEVPMGEDYVKYKYSFVRRRGLEIDYGKKLAQVIRELRPEAVMSANTPTESQTAVVQACRDVNARFVYWIQDFYSIAVSKLLHKKLPVLGGVVSAYYKYLEKGQLRGADHVVAITHDFVPLLEQWGIPASKISVIPNWAPLDELPQMPKQNPWAVENGLADKRVFLYSGTLGMKHNPALLVALAERFQNEPDVVVVVISEGIGMNWLQERQKTAPLPNLRLMSYQPFERLPEVNAAADVLVTILEPDAGVFSVPSKVLTYLCAGRALLCAISGTGLVVHPGDSPAFLAAAEKLLNDQELRDACAQKARRYAEQNFDIGEIGNRFERILFSK
jgi:colanic acid biosynthesis glycosyl transferase WcaI